MPTDRAAQAPLLESRPWHEQRWPVIVAGLGAAYVAGSLLAVIVRSQGNWNTGPAWERDVLVSVSPRLPSALDSMMLALPWLGTNITLMPVIALIAAWLWVARRRVHLAMWLLVVQLGSWGLNQSLKATFDRMRPDLFEKRGWYGLMAYPSGHAIASAAVLFTVAILLHRERGWRWPYLVALLITAGSAYSRVYLAVHWPTDVIGGLVVGFVWLWACHKAFAGEAAVTIGGLPRSRRSG